MIELIARNGYRAVRILDLTKLARVSRPTFYSLYVNKEDLFLSAYDEIAGRAAQTAMEAYATEGSEEEHLQGSMRAFAEMAAAEPDGMALVLLGALGAGARALEHRNRTLDGMERSIRASRERSSPSQHKRGARGRESGAADLTL
jgi:AcrR family transcriptional regulator